MILPGLVYKFASLRPISAYFLPQSNSGWSFSSRNIKKGKLVLQYKCKYGHLRTAGLWIMEAGCPWYSWEGEHSATQKQWEKVHNLAMYFSFPLPICTHGHQTVVRSETAALPLADPAGLWLHSLVTFFLSLSLQEMHLKCCWSGVYRRFCDNKYKDDARRLCWKTSRIERELQGVRRCRGVTLQWHCWSQVKNKTAPCSKTACKRRGRTNMFSLYSCL